ncbi:unnamed protein product [Strongylus vulgaris]|uniref:Uncharacterized protein n=1 Tax=Strongylus vulgaris TaxID=40348 RepID=A0A3P7K7Q2_STRVU|nr:unnamed protein product [Strongylus vulgaris]
MHVLVLFMTVLGYAMAAVHIMKVKRFTPPMVKMIRNGTWDRFVERMMEKPLQQMTGSDGDIYIHDITRYYDTEYLGEITIGTPQQTFLVRQTDPFLDK